MKWLEGWFGTASGVIGALIVVIVIALVPAYSESQTCSSFDGGPTTCSPMQTTTSGSQWVILIPLIIAFLLFVAVVVGTWLDLGGKRTVGRLILLISVTLLIPAFLFIVASGPDAPFAFIFPSTLLAFVTGILACVRRDEPRRVALPTPQVPVTAQE